MSDQVMAAESGTATHITCFEALNTAVLQPNPDVRGLLPPEPIRTDNKTKQQDQAPTPHRPPAHQDQNRTRPL
ncbi:hypothetical protein LTR09_002755 [Extremus antarcticus]|uniref:Uncharacterized protein n=1 Tax=Extremus antarcticus TaxID=702011 RepID=A0AAJ0GEZ0_9PEZI|nr:hypothetical protein LTR09_002755 [Extremus antarcticus]